MLISCGQLLILITFQNCFLFITIIYARATISTYNYIYLHIATIHFFSSYHTLLRFLRFFTCVSWHILPSTKLVDCADINYTSFSFFLLFFYISLLWNLEICSYLFLLFYLVFFSTLCPAHPFILFYSSFCFLFCSLPLFINFIFWFILLFSFQICYPFFSILLLLYSVCFSLLFYYYSICSVSVILHLFRALYLTRLCYVFCSCFCLFYTPSFW